MIFHKLSWRIALLQKAVLLGRMADWRGILKDICSFHKKSRRSTSSVPIPVLLDEENGFGLYQVADRKVYFLLSFHPSLLGDMYHEIFIQKVYEWGPCAISPGDWVIDAGACEGFFSLYALEKRANVLAFEPIPEIAQALEKTLAEFIAQGRAKVFPMGLGKEREEKTMFVLKDWVAGSAFSVEKMNFHGHDFASSQKQTLQITSLDALFSSSSLPPISFIKADVEGYERELPLGAKETICRYHPKLSICTYHLPDDWRVIPGIIVCLCRFPSCHCEPQSGEAISKDYQISLENDELTLGMTKQRGHSEEQSDEGISQVRFKREYKLKFSGLFDHVYGW
ncbi:MAG: FkbM family methyltransferase [Candidatus Atribacteria bacterium]|nr:FkbM family methyltransferase [Candidatus Atribacteria bacterium]